MKAPKIAIVGGGVAGVTAAIHLATAGAHVTLFEKKRSLVSGPPFCHLHAGGNLYREIGDDACVTLLEQSIDFARLYPYTIDYRPTVIAIPLEDPGNPEDLVPRLSLLRDRYRRMVQSDARNGILGPWQDYFTLFARDALEALRPLTPPAHPKRPEEWMIRVAREVDLTRLKYPIVLVREYGINLFRLGAGATLILRELPNVTLATRTEVTTIEPLERGWRLFFTDEGRQRSADFDYLVNAAGFQTGRIDEIIGITVPRMVEFKAAYVTHWERGSQGWPEIVFHGERGTPRGMAQFTPYPDGHFQIHGMTPSITLFPDGLAVAPSGYAQPRLDSRFVAKIERGWPVDIALERTQAAIDYVARFIPSFATAVPTPVPLYGAQQIPGTDITRRVAEVAFPRPRYARCEIVKVSSAPDMAEKILDDLKKERLLPPSSLPKIPPRPDEATLDALAAEIAESRGYPKALGRRLVEKPFQ